MSQPIPERSVISSRRRQPSRLPLLLLLLLVLVAAGLGGLYMLGRPTLEFSNRLAAPVLVAVDREAAQMLLPGELARIPVPFGRSLVVAWELVRPLSADSQPMGEEVRGSLVERARWGTLRRQAQARGAASDYFAPLITNATERLLQVRVNSGLEGALDCGCAVRPGTRRVFIGYYRLYQNSTVEGKTKGGRRALFRDLGPSVTGLDGTIGLRFESKDVE